MARRTLLYVLLGIAVVPVALAQNNRSAVSLLGADVNACTVASPCRSFAVALAQTNPGGEIIALDTAGYGPFTIDRSITVSGAPGAHAALSVAGGNGITVAAGQSDRVVLRNLVLIGNGGTMGLNITSAAQTRVIDCFVRGFTAAGIAITGPGSLSVDRCTVIEDGQAGISVASNTTATAHGTINDCLIAGNMIGVASKQYGAVVVVGSRITGNATGAAAISVGGSGSAPADLTLERCTIANSSTAGVNAITDGGNNVARVAISSNVFAYNSLAVSSAGTGTVSSFQNNRFALNTSDGSFSNVSFQ